MRSQITIVALVLLLVSCSTINDNKIQFVTEGEGFRVLNGRFADLWKQEVGGFISFSCDFEAIAFEEGNVWAPFIAIHLGKETESFVQLMIYKLNNGNTFKVVIREFEEAQKGSKLDPLISMEIYEVDGWPGYFHLQASQDQNGIKFKASNIGVSDSRIIEYIFKPIKLNISEVKEISFVASGISGMLNCEKYNKKVVWGKMLRISPHT